MDDFGFKNNIVPMYFPTERSYISSYLANFQRVTTGLEKSQNKFQRWQWLVL